MWREENHIWSKSLLFCAVGVLTVEGCADRPRRGTVRGRGYCWTCKPKYFLHVYKASCGFTWYLNLLKFWSPYIAILKWNLWLMKNFKNENALCRPVANNVNTFSLKEKWCVALNLFYLLSSIAFLKLTTHVFTLEGLHFLIMQLEKLLAVVSAYCNQNAEQPNIIGELPWFYSQVLKKALKHVGLWFLLWLREIVAFYLFADAAEASGVLS